MKMVDMWIQLEEFGHLCGAPKRIYDIVNEVLLVVVK